MARTTHGITRALDDLGRVVIPKSYRTILGIANRDEVEFIVRGNVLEIRKAKPVHACGSCNGSGRELALVEPITA